jgi:hypothetical protein
VSDPRPSSVPKPDEVDPETGTDPEEKPIDNPSGAFVLA